MYFYLGSFLIYANLVVPLHTLKEKVDNLFASPLTLVQFIKNDKSVQISCMY